jgi:hypothetical protein
LKLELLVGGKKRRPELGETSVSIAPAGSDDFRVLSLEKPCPLTDAAWLAWERARRDDLGWI